MESYWYCPECKTEVDGSCVTFSEHHDGCGSPVLWIEPGHIVIKEAEIEQLQAELNEAAGLLDIANCPENCIDGAYPDNHGEPVQCQFCYEREQVVQKAKERCK